MKSALTEKITHIFDTRLCNTYNSYFIEGEKRAVVDLISDTSEKELFFKADYIILTQTAPRCAELLEELLDTNRDVILVGTTATLRNYHEILNRDFNEHVVKNGEILDIGGAKLQFYITPNIKQPDTMIVYENESKILFSGNLYSSYDTEDGKAWYYSDNLSMYEDYVMTAQQLVQSIQPARICPYIGTEYDGTEEYLYRFEEKTGLSAAVYYSSGYGFTKMIAEALCDGLREAGVSVMMFDTDSDDWDDMCRGLKSDILMIGSSTRHRNISKSTWKLISELAAVNTKNTLAVAFGSYGWSGEGVKIIENLLKAVRVKVYPAPQTAVYKPTCRQLEEMTAFAREFAENMK